MNFNEYQAAIEKFDLFEQKDFKASDPAFMAKVLGLAGEAGEVAEKFKKILRDKDGAISEADKLEILKEMGDVLWYLATISRYLKADFQAVAGMNIGKLSKRLETDKLHGSGDNR